MDTTAFPYLFLVLCLFPMLGFLLWNHLHRNKVTVREKRYSSLIGLQTVPSRVPSLSAWFLGACFLMAVLAQARTGWRRVNEESKARIALFLPESPMEFRSWVLVSLLAGIGE